LPNSDTPISPGSFEVNVSTSVVWVLTRSCAEWMSSLTATITPRPQLCGSAAIATAL
jgi:hypothetical protein